MLALVTVSLLADTAPLELRVQVTTRRIYTPLQF